MLSTKIPYRAGEMARAAARSSDDRSKPVVVDGAGGVVEVVSGVGEVVAAARKLPQGGAEQGHSEHGCQDGRA